jgi:PAS domain S-box-containing protein
MELQLETIIHSVEDAILSVDDQGLIVFLNESAARMFGCSRKLVTGKPVATIPTLAAAVFHLKLDELKLSGDSPKAVRRIPIAQAG